LLTFPFSTYRDFICEDSILKSSPDGKFSISIF